MLSLAAAALALGGGAHASEVWFVILGMVPLLAVWAYAISMGAHGSRTALVALAVYVAIAGCAGPILVWGHETASGLRMGVVLAVVVGIVAALTLWALVDETRRRGGPIRLGTLLGLLLPLLAAGLALYAVDVLAASQGMDPMLLDPGADVRQVPDPVNGSA